MRICVGLVLLVSVSALGLDLMGPPKSGLDCGQWGAGVAFFGSNEDVDLEGLAVEDLEMYRYTGWLSLGVNPFMEVYFRGGLMDAETEFLGAEYESDGTFTGTVGTKVTLIEGETVDWGFLVQGGWSDLEDVDLSDFGLGEVETDFWELQAAFGPTVTFDWIKFYGGPFFYRLDGDIDFLGDTYNFEEDHWGGGYVGTVIDLPGSAAFCAEGVFTGGGYGIGVNIGWEF
jgi:hypothetical protein